MQILITDDCNLAWDEKIEFFVYGGIVVPESEMRVLAEQLLEAKRNLGVPKERPVKWTNNRWKGQPPLDEKTHAALKNQILDIVAASGVRIIVCLSPQSFYHRAKLVKGSVTMSIDPSTQLRTQKYGLNDTLSTFHWYLSEGDDIGMVFADKFGHALKHDMDEHCFDEFPNNAHPRIVHPIVQLDNEQSHLHQINDVVLGAIYFSLREMGYNFLPRIRDNFWMAIPNNYSSIINRGFSIYPQIAKTMYIRQGKADLQDKFLRLITAI